MPRTMTAPAAPSGFRRAQTARRRSVTRPAASDDSTWTTWPGCSEKAIEPLLTLQLQSAAYRPGTMANKANLVLHVIHYRLQPSEGT